jgi:hypothetical protein
MTAYKPDFIMAQNQALAFTDLKDVLFSEEVITKSVEREHIFEMKDEANNSLGFISSTDLKSYVFNQGVESDNYFVKNIDSSEWTSLFTHPSFQRRKPQLVPAAALAEDTDQQFFILKNGQKTGPYEKFEMLSMLKQKELLLTDMVSTNAGHTWMKLFQVDNFDRRVLKESDQLPGVPAQAIMGHSESVASTITSTDAISSLAYLSNVKRGKTVEREKVENFKSDYNTQNNSSSLYKWLLVGSIIGIAYFGFHIKNQLTSPFKSDAQTVGEQTEMLSPVDMNGENQSSSEAHPQANKLGEKRNINQINDTQRNNGKFQPRVFQPIRPAAKKSFMDTSNYQNTQINAQEDPNYFYDNTSAMELDPVRSQVSKENYDNSASESEGPIPSSDNLFENEIPASSN